MREGDCEATKEESVHVEADNVVCSDARIRLLCRGKCARSSDRSPERVDVRMSTMAVER